MVEWIPSTVEQCQLTCTAGPSLIYISPDPPTDDSFVKIWHEGLFETSTYPNPGKWSTSNNIAKNGGSMNFRIPAGLKAGQYVSLPSKCKLSTDTVKLSDPC